MTPPTAPSPATAGCSSCRAVGTGYTRVGTVARVENEGELPGGQRALVLRGLSRAVVGRTVPSDHPGLWVEADPVAEPAAVTGRAKEMVREYRAVVRGIAEKLGNPRIADALAGVDDPGALADTAGWAPDLAVERKVELLEELDPEARLEKALDFVRETLAELDLSEQIRSRVTEGMDKTQREFLLRQQLSAIREELGENGDADDAVAEYRTKLSELVLPDDVRVRGRSARSTGSSGPASRAPSTGGSAPGSTPCLEIPWGTHSDETLDVGAAREILDADHTGLEDVKDRIVEYLAVRKLRSERGMSDSDQPAKGRRGAGAILALVGPPGVGKTSLGESVARSLGREFVRVALGGVHDEAELRGHRRTYVGARPGRIVRALTEAGTMNPVIVLDEVDKLGNDWRGDPSSALLEVLDPAQNHTFRDHYLEVDLDLSDVLFLATAQRARYHPRTAAGPAGDHPARRLHGGREGRHRPRPPARPSARTQRAHRRRRVGHRRRAACRRHRPHAGGGGPQPRARAGQAAAQDGGEAASEAHLSGTATPPITIDADDVQPALGRAEVPQPRRPNARACPAWRPVSR